jgi:hypothetical protein
MGVSNLEPHCLHDKQMQQDIRHFNSKANPRTVMEIEEVKSGRHVEIWGKRYSQASSEANTFVTNHRQDMMFNIHASTDD